ncbi:MAG: lipoyl synthase [candidate division Zixibacteria bacterium]|nr:lipoyl synthase [candidate division Zixibacteria bacterium]
MINQQPERKPAWLKVRPFTGERYNDLHKKLRGLALRTVCEEANCPNRGECFNSGTATFLLMGSKCTRNCKFCDIDTGRPAPLDIDEPQKIAELSAHLGLDHVVVTSVCRDDLPDEGAEHFAQTIKAIKELLPTATVEVLVPDFHGRQNLLETVLQAEPTVFNHNVETVPRLYSTVRSAAKYQRSLDVLSFARENYPNIMTKSGIMLGLGETEEELHSLFEDIAQIGVEVLTIGQYLAPSKQHHPVIKYYSPEEFDRIGDEARALGIKTVVAGPLVRSSYKAADVLRKN